MTSLVLSHNDVLQAVRTSKCSTAKKRKPTKLRVGVYGPTLARAKERLAEKLGVAFTVVSSFVDSLMRERKLRFAGKRLMPASNADRTKVTKRQPVIPAVTHQVIIDLRTGTTDIDVDPELNRWPEYMGQLHARTGDLFRQAIWGSEIVPVIDDEDGWQLKSREDVMSAHPSNMARRLSVA